jgi:hypothetical protein
VIVGFAVWKSPLSQPLIDLGRVLGFARFGRVVDYSDLVALAIVPLGYGVANNLHRFQIARARVTRALSGPSLAVALLAVLGTSVASYRESYIIRKTDGLEQFDGMLAARLIADVAKKNDLECVICDRVAEIAEYHGHSISRRYQISDQRSIAFSIMALPPRSFFSNSNSRERRLSHAISEPLSVAT